MKAIPVPQNSEIGVRISCKCSGRSGVTLGKYAQSQKNLEHFINQVRSHGCDPIVEDLRYEDWQENSANDGPYITSWREESFSHVVRPREVMEKKLEDCLSQVIKNRKK